MNTYLEKSIHHIRKSAAVLVLRVVFGVFLIDSFYALVLVIAFSDTSPNNFLTTPPYEGATFTLLWSIHTLQFFITILVLVSLVVRWTKTTYYITGHQLVYQRGIIKIDETIYELTHIRTVKVYQSWIGRIFNYGKITLVLAVSGYHEEVQLGYIIDPKKYEKVFRGYIEEMKK